MKGIYNKRQQQMKQWLKEAVHNCIIHPLLPFLPEKIGDKLHRKNALWTYGEKQVIEHEKSTQH